MIEVAAIITDKNLNIPHKGPVVAASELTRSSTV